MCAHGGNAGAESVLPIFLGQCSLVRQGGPRELFHRDGVTLTERHVLVAPTHLANRHLLIAS